MKRTMFWLISNSAFVSALWFGYHDGVRGAQNVAAFFVWFLFIASLFTTSESIRASLRAKGPPVSLWLEGILGIVIVLFLVWSDHPWMGTAMAIHQLMVNGAYSKEQEA